MIQVRLGLQPQTSQSLQVEYVQHLYLCFSHWKELDMGGKD